VLSSIWIKSTFSGARDCVEVAREAASGILLRDSKDPSGPMLAFTETEWRAFLDGAKAGEFDL
jgi:hypothetical protein